MTPVVIDALQQFLIVAVPAVLSFVAGHYHLLLANPLAAPATPSATPSTPVSPSAPLTLGHGELLGVLASVLQGILAHPTATPQQKSDAINGVVNATASLVK